MSENQHGKMGVKGKCDIKKNQRTIKRRGLRNRKEKEQLDTNESPDHKPSRKCKLMPE